MKSAIWIIEKIDKGIEKGAFAILSASLFLMLGLTLLNIAARWFDSTFTWIDPLVRHLVFLSAFMGAVLATGKGSHIKIDVAGRALEALGKKKLQKTLSILIGAVAAMACYFLFKAGRDFSLVEFEYGREAFMGIHSGWLVSIIPFGFALIGARFLTKICLTFKNSV